MVFNTMSKNPGLSAAAKPAVIRGENQVDQVRSAAITAAGAPGLSDITPETLAQLPAAQRQAIRERAEAVGWLARTVADAAPGLRPARYKDALEQARAMGIPIDNLPPTYHANLDPLLRQYGDEAQAFLGRLGDRGNR